MNWVRDKLSSIGLFLAFAGGLSSVLQLAGYELRIFRALNAAGPATAWGVRIGCLVVGVLLFLVADRGAKAQATDEWGAYRTAALGDPRMRTFLDLVRQRIPHGTIAHHVFMTQAGEVLPAGDPRAHFLIAYVQSSTAPERVQVAQTLATGEIAQTELSAVSWSAVVH